MTPTLIHLPDHLSDFTQALKRFLVEVNSQTTVSVAFSGGLDSTVLLHLLSQHELSRSLKNHLYAHYVDHGLQVLSLDWKLHCQQVCELFQVPFESSVINIKETQRKGIESVARKLRYQVLSARLPVVDDILVTGHHQRDQAETVLLNLARGAGVAGLSAMPYQKIIRLETGSVRHVRPLLTIQYEKLVAYADYFKLRWIEDPSNSSLNFKRNVIRHEVLPVLQAHWPNAEVTIARSAQNMSEALILLNRMASLALAPHDSLHASLNYYLDLNLFHDLDWLEKKNIIRFWFSKASSQPLTLKHYEWILSVLLVKGVSRQNAFSYHLSKGEELAFYQGRLYYLPEKLKSFTSTLSAFLHTVEVHKVNHLKDSTPVSGRALVTRNYDLIIREELLVKSHLIEVRSISQDDDLKRKKLKSYFQINSIPIWERKVWPVLVLDGQLVAVLGCSNCLNTSEDFTLKSSVNVKIKVPKLLLWQFMGVGVKLD